VISAILYVTDHDIAGLEAVNGMITLNDNDMAERDHQENNPSPSRKANPSDTGQDKATLKEGKTTDGLKNEEEIIEKHTNDGEIPSHLQKGTNRNTDKPDIDKPAYGSSK